ncbi:hypothetical protein D3C87_1951910 [compost metagenome]
MRSVAQGHESDFVVFAQVQQVLPTARVMQRGFNGVEPVALLVAVLRRDVDLKHDDFP